MDMVMETLVVGFIATWVILLLKGSPRGEWRPMETAPRDGTPILVYDNWDGEIHQAKWGISDKGVKTWISGIHCRHVAAQWWMPLPVAPREIGGKE